ncbi:MAG: hypothetical protein U0271_48355 [Polyangiaceae bacterium]
MNQATRASGVLKVTPDAQTPSLGRPFETSWEAENVGGRLDLPRQAPRGGMGLANFPIHQAQARDLPT